jgi:hypothetical protein
MADQWIPASKALELVGNRFALCERLESGLIASRARLLILGKKEMPFASVPRGFWWARGREALEQNWNTGDFETWIEQRDHWRAFGVELRLPDVLDMLPTEQRSGIARSLSVVGNPDWVSAKEARRIAYAELGHNPASAGEAIIELARQGFAIARAVSVERAPSNTYGAGPPWTAREWDVPSWFWDNFTRPGHSHFDWEIGKFVGDGVASAGVEKITLSGVHFFRSSLVPETAASPPKDVPFAKSRGRTPAYDWEKAKDLVWGQIAREELIPTTLADVERALADVLASEGHGPGESTIRTHARPIYAEYHKV